MLLVWWASWAVGACLTLHQVFTPWDFAAAVCGGNHPRASGTRAPSEVAPACRVALACAGGGGGAASGRMSKGKWCPHSWSGCVHSSEVVSQVASGEMDFWVRAANLFPFFTKKRLYIYSWMSLLVLLMKKETSFKWAWICWWIWHSSCAVLSSALYTSPDICSYGSCMRVFVFHVGISVFGTSGSFRASPTFTRNIANIKTRKGIRALDSVLASLWW